MSGIDEPARIPLSGQGNLIGVENAPDIYDATGLWSIPDHLKARQVADWPFSIGGYWMQVTRDPSGDIPRERVYQLIDSTDTPVLRFVGTANIPQARGRLAFSSDRTGYRMTFGGLSRWSFASDNFAALESGAGYPDNNYRNSDMSFHSASDGYSGGGLASDFIQQFSNWFKWPFATETRAGIGSMPYARWSAANVATPSNGYVFGGARSASFTPNRTNEILSLPFAVETWSLLAAVMSDEAPMGGGAGSSTAAYIAHQRTGQPQYFDKFEYATETIASLPIPTPFRSLTYATAVRAVSIGFGTGTGVDIRFFDFATENYTSQVVTVGPFHSAFGVGGSWLSQV